MIIKDNKKINPIISDKDAKNKKVNLQTEDGKDFGEISVSAYSAIRGNYIDRYSPVDANEKKVLDNYKKYIAALYPETKNTKKEKSGEKNEQKQFNTGLSQSGAKGAAFDNDTSLRARTGNVAKEAKKTKNRGESAAKPQQTDAFDISSADKDSLLKRRSELDTELLTLRRLDTGLHADSTPEEVEKIKNLKSQGNINERAGKLQKEIGSIDSRLERMRIEEIQRTYTYDDYKKLQSEREKLKSEYATLSGYYLTPAKARTLPDDKINEIKQGMAKRDNIIQQIADIDNKLTDIENAGIVDAAVAERYGINDLSKFDMTALGDWAKKHNYNEITNSTTGMVSYEPKKTGGILGIGGKKLTTEQEEKDFKILSRIANENLNIAMGKNMPVSSSVGTIVQAPARSVSNIVAAADDLIKASNAERIDTDSVWHRASNNTNLLRETVSQEHASKWFGGAEIGGQKLGSFLYNTAMSAGDNAVNMAVGSGAGKLAAAAGASAKTVQAIVSGTVNLLMSGGAAGDSIVQNKKRGLSDKKAVGLGIASGIIEALTEKYSIDAIIKEPKTFMRGLMKSFAAEGSEEIASNLANKVLDQIVNGEDSEISQSIKQYIAGGASKTDAAKWAIADSITDDFMAGLSGGISGVAMSGAHQGVSRLQIASAGNDLIKADLHGGIIDEALKRPQGSEARAAAEELSKKSETAKKNGKEYKPTGYDIGNIYVKLSEETAAGENTDIGAGKMFAPDTASDDIKDFDKYLMNVKAPAAVRERAVEAVQTLESSLAENSNATTQQALQALKKSVNSAAEHIGMQTHTDKRGNADKSGVIAAGADFISSKDNIITPSFILSWAQYFDDSLKRGGGIAYREAAENTDNFALSLAEYAAGEISNEQLTGNKAFVLLGNTFKNELANAVRTNYELHNMLYENNPVLDVQYAAAAQGDFSFIANPEKAVQAAQGSYGDNNVNSDIQGAEKDITLTRVGDFYEAYGDDAVELAEKLDLIPTTKTVNGEKVQMVGFPVSSFDRYKNILGNNYNISVSDTPSVTSINEQNMPVSTENTPANEAVTNIDVDMPEGEILSLKHTKNVYSLFKGALRIVVGKDIITDGFVVLPLTDESLAGVKKVVGDSAPIQENPNLTMSKFYHADNDVIIQGNPKVGEATAGNKTVKAYTFKIADAFYSCQQKFIDAFNNGKNVIKANKSNNIPWTVHNENGDLVALFLGLRANVTEQSYNQMQSVAEIKAAEQQKKAENANKPFNQNEVRLLIENGRPFFSTVHGINYVGDGHIFTVCDEAAADFIKAEYRKQNANSNYEIEHKEGFGGMVEKLLAEAKDLAEANNPISYSGADTLGRTANAYIVGDYAILFNKKYADLIKKHSKSMKIISNGKIGTTILVGYDADGNITGFALPILVKGNVTTKDGKSVPFVGEADIKRLVKETAANETKSDKSVIETPESVTNSEKTEENTPVAEEKTEYKHLYNEETVSEDFINSVNPEIESAILNIRNGNIEAVPDVIEIAELTEETIKKISDFVGFDVSGYSCKIEKDALQHIENRHGINGSHDHSLSDPKDTARMGYIVNNSDSVDWIREKDGAVKTSKKYRDKNNKPAKLVMVQKKIDGTYCVSDVVPDSKNKTIWVTSARIQKKHQDLDDNNVSPKTTPENALNASDTIIAEETQNVNTSEEIATPTLTDKCELHETTHPKTDEDIWVVRLKGRISAEEFKELRGKVKAVGGWYSQYVKTPDGKAIPGFVFKTEPGADEIGVFNDFFASETETPEPVSTETKTEETPEPLKNSAESDTIKETDNKESVEDVHTAVLERKNTDLDSGIQSEDAQSSEEAGHVERESGNVSGRSSVTDDISAPKYEADQSSEESDPGRTVNNGVGERNDSIGDDRGNNDFDNQISDTVEKAPAQSKPKNYSMTKDVAEYIDKKPPSKEDNLEAIRVLHELENTGKKPTKAQLEALAKYKGWGGLSSAFLNWQIKDLEAVMTEEEIKAARATVEDAYYTPTYIIDAVYKALNRLGFEGGNVLEPSMGIGNFFAKMPKKVMEASKLFGVEIDGVSGRIASYLYPDAQITIDGFQNTAYKDGSFDLVVGNVPFGDVKYSYKGKKYLIHDFFFRKSLDKVADGGLMVFITSKGTMDKADYSLRAELASQADLVAAYRLPSSVFDRSAGASVATDIIILQKKENGSTNGVNFKNVGEIDGIAINEYFVEHPENIIGELTLRTNQFGKPVSTVKATGDVSAMLTKAMNKLPKGLLNGVSTTGTVDVTDYTGTTQHYTENGKNVEFVDSVTGEVKTITGKKATIAKDYIKLRDTYNELISASLNEESTATIENLRKKLKADYAAFKSKHGYVTEHKGTLADDVDFVKVSGLEVYDTKTKDYIMSEVFEKDTLTRRKPTKADNALDALGISIGEIGKVDVKLIAQLVGKTENEVLSELADKIILTPDGTYELNEVYLSGNIREKLRQVEGKKGFEKNAEMLKAVMPEEIKAKDISPQFGAPWISPKYIADFLRETFELYSTPKVNYDSTSGTWSVEQVWGNNTLMTKKYGTSYQDAMKIAEKALNMRKIIIKDRDGVTLVGETRAAQQKADDIRNAFEEWCFKDTDRRNDLVRIFNEKFNSHRSMDFSELAEYLTFDGMSETFKLRDYQRRAVARTVFNGNTLLAHGVGTGKTAEMIASAMELKRLGVVKKNLMVVPNHKTADFRNDILKMYPSAKVIVLDKGAKVADRQKFFSQVASGDWDICIVPHSSFALLDVTAETKRAFIQNQIDELEDVLTQAQADKGKTFDGRFVRQLENQKKKLQAKLEDVTNAPKDKGMVFEELGVDSLFVDEAHNFKSLPFYTKLGRVAGVASTESTRAENMFMITDYINHTGGRVNFATATPITNSMTEIYNMIRFLRPEILKDAGISSFDAWASMFGSIVNEAEIDPTGRNMRMKERFSKFKNVSQMVEQFRRMADILKTGDVIQTLPDVERIDVINESNELQEEFLDVLDGMVAEIQSGGQKDATLNMLTVTKAGQMAAIDLRMIHSFFEGKYSKEDLEVSGNRTSKAAERIYNEYKNSNGIKGTQFVFCDYGIHDNPGARYDFNVYNDLINKLVAAGIPREEIAVAQDFKDKAELSGKVNTGEIRVLIGSTQVMGEGMNAQERAVALHHLTVPDRPSDIEQREGRIIRFGNINKNVRIYRYIQERSYDSYQWQMQERKASFINQALSNGQAAELEEMSDFVLTAREAKAIASGNPLLLEKMDVEDKLNKVRHARNRFNSDKLDMQDRMKRLPAKIAALRKEITALKTDVETVQKNQSDDFKIRLYGKTFTERSAAAESLDVLLAKVPKNGEYVKIGEYLGLDVLFSSSIQHGRKFALKGAGTYTVDAGDSALGNITRLTNLANKLADEALQKETIAGVFEKELKTLEKEVKAEFPQAKELEELQAKLDEINTQIGADNEKDMSTVIVDDTPEDGGSPGGVRSSRDLPASASTYENYTYNALTRKDDMFVTTLDTESVRDEKGKLNRDDVVKKGLENVRAKNNPRNTNENAYVYIPDVDRDVLVGKRGLTHGLSRNADATALVTTKIGDILENAIRVNELYPRKNTAGGYILLGLAKDENKNYYPVRVVVNKHSTVEEVEVLDVLYAVNAKKKNQSSNEAELPADAVPPIKGSSTISIADLLEIVKDNFSDVLTDDVLETLGVERTESPLSEDLKFYHEADSSADYEHRWNTESTSDTEKTGVTLAGIIKSISESFGIPIATGKVTDREASGIYKSKPETVRTRITNNLPTVAHELGHHLDKIYNLSKLPGVKELKKSIPAEFLENYKISEERDGEAVAEFIRVYLKNANEANKLCPEFYNEFIRALSSEDLTAINNIASAVNEYLSYDLSERYDAAIVSSQKKEKLSFREKWQKLYTNWVDAFHPQKEAMDYVETVTGEKTTGQNNAYVLATNSMNAHARAHHVICEEFCDLNGNVVPGAKSFVDSIGMVDSKDVRLLDKYLVLKHSLEWIAPEQDDVQTKRVFADDTLENVEEIKKQIAAIERVHPEIKTAADNLYEYQNNILKHFVIPAGGMTLDTMNTLNRKYPNYVPFYRAIGKKSGFAKGTFANQRTPIMRAKGSGAEIISPVESIIRNTEKMVKFAMRNQVMQAWAYYADNIDGFGQFMERVPPDLIPHFTDITGKKEQFADALQQVVSSGDDYFAVSNLLDEVFGNSVSDFTPVANANKKIVTVLENGKPSYYQIHDDAFYESVAELSPKQTSGLLKVMNSIMQPMKLLITQNNPIFAATNALRDFGTAYKLSEINNPVTFAAQYAKALGDIITNSESYQQYKAMGGGHSSELSANIDDISKTLRKVAQKDMGKARRLAYSIFRHPVETVAAINDAVESVPRFMEFQRTLKNGGDLQNAIFNADDITTNFKRSGKGDTAKAVNNMIMFNNAAIQGLDKMFRTITTKDPKKRHRILLKWVLHALIMGIIGYLYNKEVDEEGYKNLSSYKKNNFYNYAIGDGKFVSLPKPRENALLDSFTERTIEYLFGDNEEAFYDFGSYLGSQLLPPMLPDTLNPVDAVHSVLGSTVLGGLVDVGFNQDFKGTPIEGKYDEYLPSNERYNENTSKLAYGLGQTKLARNLDMSPKKIDHLISSYTGILGQVNKALLPMNENRRDISIGLRNKFISDSNYSTDVLNRMYENEEKAEKAFNYSGTIDTAIEYEKNTVITSYISGMNKAVKALPEDEQRNGRAYLLKTLNSWDYNDTASQSNMLRTLDGSTISKDVIFSELPSSTLEWTVKKQKYVYQMTPQEYYEYISNYLTVIENARKHYGGNTVESYEKAKEAAKDYMSDYKKNVLKEQYLRKAVAKAE